MHAYQVYETGILQNNEGNRIEVSDKFSEGDQLIVSAAKCYKRALQIEHENFEDLYPEFLNEFLRQNNIIQEDVDDTLKLHVSIEYRSGDLKYCLFLNNYLNLAIDIFGSDIEGFDQDYLSLKELCKLAEALMPEGHYYYQKWLQVKETAELNGVLQKTPIG